MIIHTLLMSFNPTLSDPELDQVLSDIDGATRASGVVESFAAAPHLAVPGEEDIPAFIGSAVVQIGVADLGALGTLFTSPEVAKAFEELRGRHPYSAAWVNHAPLT